MINGNVFMNFSKYALGFITLLLVITVTAQTQAIATGEVEWPASLYFDFIRALAALLR